MTNPELDGSDDVRFTQWDRRMIAAINVAHAARQGVMVLRVAAVVIALAAVIGTALVLFSDVSDAGGAMFETTIDRQTVGQFLASIASPLAFAGIVLALSYVLQVAAARLDIDIVLADEDEAPEGSDD
ncbi:MAG: hypothetical protein RL238_3851 [Actinomycetota bacterium]